MRIVNGFPPTSLSTQSNRDKATGHDWKQHAQPLSGFSYIACGKCGVSLRAAHHFGWECK
jgi:hypothetical protein